MFKCYKIYTHTHTLSLVHKLFAFNESAYILWSGFKTPLTSCSMCLCFSLQFSFLHLIFCRIVLLYFDGKINMPHFCRTKKALSSKYDTVFCYNTIYFAVTVEVCILNNDIRVGNSG